MEKNLNKISEQLVDAVELESAFRAYINKKEKYCKKYNVKIDCPSTEVDRLHDILNGEVEPLMPMPSKKKTKVNSKLSDSDLLL